MPGKVLSFIYHALGLLGAGDNAVSPEIKETGECMCMVKSLGLMHDPSAPKSSVESVVGLGSEA